MPPHDVRDPASTRAWQPRLALALVCAAISFILVSMLLVAVDGASAGLLGLPAKLARLVRNAF